MTSVLSAKVRKFIVLVDVNGAHPNLMPDLTASLDVTLARSADAIVVPRDALRQDGRRTVVRVQRGGRFEDRAVTVAAVNAHEAVVVGRPRSGRGRRPQRLFDKWTAPVIAATRRFFLRPRNAAYRLALVTIAAAGTSPRPVGAIVPDLPTARVTRGEFVDTLEIRGDIRPLKSIVLSSPMQSGDLQILKLAKNGTMVKPGDVLVQFDPSTLERTIQEKQSELKQADAEIEQAQAQARITQEQNATALMKAGTTSSAPSWTPRKGTPCPGSRSSRRSWRSWMRSRSSAS